MAEFVERHMQEMVPEVEEMETLGLLTKEEIKKLIQRRRDFEYKISKLKKEKHAYVNYALYDIKLLELLALRKKKLMMDKKTPKITYSFTMRVLKRLRYMTTLWPTHPDIWNLRISFSKAYCLDDEVSVTYANMIHFRGNEEGVWVAWAQWEMEGRQNFHNARQILLSRAPLYHPHSLLITKEYFRLELLYIEFLNNQSQKGEAAEGVTAENREKVLNCRAPEIIYEKSLSEFESPDLFLEFFSAAMHFPFARKLAERIFSDLVTKFPNDKNIWKLKCQMLMEGRPDFATRREQEEDKEGDKKGEEKEEDKKGEEQGGKGEKIANEQDREKQDLNPTEKLEKLFELYDEALVEVGSPFLECVFQDLFQLLNEVWGVEGYKALVTEKLLAVFEEHADDLTSEQFLHWFKLGLHLSLSGDKLTNVLELAHSNHPNCPYIQMVYFPFVKPKLAKQDMTNIIENCSGKVGAEVCMQVISNATQDSREKLIEKACIHHDVVLAREMRVKHLELSEDLSTAREIYEKYSCIPPFCLRFHVSMVVRELKQEEISVPHLRKVFDKMIEQFGKTQPCSWICLIEFERKYGASKKAGHILEEAEKKLKAKYLPEFMDYKVAVQTSLSKQEEKSASVLVDCPDYAAEDLSPYEFWTKSTLPQLFEGEVVLMNTAERERRKFFDCLSIISKDFTGADTSMRQKINLKEWEVILSLIHGENVSLAVKKVNLDSLGVDQEALKFIQTTEEKMKKVQEHRGEKLSAELDPGRETSKNNCTISKELKKIIESSDTLQPDFLQQQQIIPYYLSKNAAKKKRAKVRSETKGEGWFNMKAPEKTPEVNRELQILKMRSALDSKTKYKRNDMKQMPEYFQMGKVVDSPLDFHSSRIPKKHRKATMAEEIINNEEVLSYQKKKFTELVEKQEMGRRKRKKFGRTGMIKKNKKMKTKQ